MSTKADKKRRVAASEIQAYLDSRSGLERDNLLLIMQRSRLYKRLAIGGTAIGAVGIIVASVVNLRAEQPAPDWLWVLNTETGVPQRVSTVVPTETLGERADSYWAAQFVRHYESYEYNTIQDDWDAVGLMAAPNLAEAYRKRIKTGQGALLDTLGDDYQIKVDIRSAFVDVGSAIATVRFTTTRYNVRDNYEEPPRYWVAKFGYEYSAIPSTEDEKAINPFGYQVNGYRPHPEGS